MSYLAFAYCIYILHHWIRSSGTSVAMLHSIGLGLAGLFIFAILQFEKEEMKKIPYLNKLYGK